MKDLQLLTKDKINVMDRSFRHNITYKTTHMLLHTIHRDVRSTIRGRAEELVMPLNLQIQFKFTPPWDWVKI